MSHRGDYDRDRYFGGGGGGGGGSYRGREPYRRDDGGGGYDRARDRSRDDRDRSGPPRGGGYGGCGGGGHAGRGGGGGHGGGRGRGRGGGGGRGRGFSAPRPGPNEPYQVLTNFFKVLCTLSASGGYWTVYHVDIIDAIRKKKVGPDGNFFEPWQWEVVPKLRGGAEKALDLEQGGNAVSRRALRALYEKLQEEDRGTVFAFDGGNKVVAPKQLFAETKKIGQGGDGNKVSADAGRYGPAAEAPGGGGGGAGGGNGPAPAEALERHYEVRILANADADAPDADRAKYEWKILKLKEVDVIAYNTIRDIFSGRFAAATGEQEHLQQQVIQQLVVKQCIEIVWKNAALFSGMKLLGKSDRLFYFPEETQQGFIQSRLLSPQVLLTLPNSQIQAVYAGLKIAIQMNRSGGVYFVGKILNELRALRLPRIFPIRMCLFSLLLSVFVPTFPFTLVHVADTDIDIMNRNRTPDNRPIPILNEQSRGSGTIAGVRIDNVHQKITDRRMREEVRKALDNLTLHMSYNKSSAWEDSECNQLTYLNSCGLSNIY